MSTKLERLFAEYQWAIDYLTTDQETGEDTGHLKVPCSRYGWNGAECAPVAVVAAVIAARANGEDLSSTDCARDGAQHVGCSRADLDYSMSLVVNDHDDITYLLREYGPSELGISWRTLRDQLLA